MITFYALFMAFFFGVSAIEASKDHNALGRFVTVLSLVLCLWSVLVVTL